MKRYERLVKILIATLTICMAIFIYQDWNTYILSLSMDNIGALAKGDKVTIRGVKVGKVDDISYIGNDIIVNLQIRNNIKVPKNSIFKCQPYSIMGDRNIEINFSNNTLFLQDGDTIYNNSFTPGLESFDVKSGLEILQTATKISKIIEDIDSIKVVIDKVQKAKLSIDSVSSHK